MKVIKFYFIFLVLLLSGCHKGNINREFSYVKDSTFEMTGHDVVLLNAAQIPIDTTIMQKLTEGITRNEAIGIALKNNPELQVHFETLGIAKADLEQAGLYTNPDINGFFWTPLQDSATELETGISFRVSDLWQVPLKKKVQKDILETVTFRILEFVLETMKNVRIIYDRALFAQARLQLLDDLKQQSLDLRDNIYYRQGFGLESDLDKYLIDIAVNNVLIDIIKSQNEYVQACIALKKILGVAPSPDPVKLTECADECIEHFKQILPSLETLQNWALIHRPEIFKAHMKIQQFKDTIALEKSKVFRTVNAGVALKRDFDSDKGIGPSFELSLPVFDQNQAQITRAEFLLEQVKKELLAIQLDIQKEVQTHYVDFVNHEKILRIYTDSIVPLYEKAVDYTDEFAQIMQITMVTVLHTEIGLIHNQILAVDIKQDICSTFSRLERAVGKRIDLIDQDAQITIGQDCIV